MKATILLAALMGVSSFLMAQSGEIRGKVLYSEDGKPVYSVNIRVVDAAGSSGATSELDGSFKIKPLSPGTYTLELTYIGYKPQRIVGIKVYSDKITFLDDIKIEQDIEVLKEFVVTAYKDKLIDPEGPQKLKVSADILIKSPGPKNAVAMAQRLSSDIKVENNQMIVRGSRPGTSTVIVDGVKVRDEVSKVPSMMIGSIEIYTGGIPAKYGDVTGGVVIINTKSYFDLVNERRAREY